MYLHEENTRKNKAQVFNKKEGCQDLLRNIILSEYLNYKIKNHIQL